MGGALLGLAAIALVALAFFPFSGRARVTVGDQDVTIELTGLHKIYALKSRLRIPLQHVAEARVEPQPLRQRVGTRLPGTAIPGYRAGSYRRGGSWTFMDTRRGPALDLRLTGEHYDRVIVQVPDPERVVSAINAARPRA